MLSHTFEADQTILESFQYRALTGRAVLQRKMYENHGYIHVCCHVTGEDTPLRSKYVYKYKSFITLVICSKFLPFKDLHIGDNFLPWQAIKFLNKL